MAVSLGFLRNDGGRFQLFDGDHDIFDPATPSGTGLPKTPLSELFRVKGRATEILLGASPEKAAGSGGDQGAEQRAQFIRRIDSVSREFAEEFAKLLPKADVRRVVDFGCGGGTYTHAVLTRYPDALGLLVDRPDAKSTVLAIAEERGFAQRLEFAALDFIHDPLPGGHDLAILSNVIHCFGAETNQELIGRIATSLEPGAMLAIKDYVVTDDHSGPAQSLRFALNMALCSNQGSVYSPEMVQRWCANAGFDRTDIHIMVQAEGSYTVVAHR